MGVGETPKDDLMELAADSRVCKAVIEANFYTNQYLFHLDVFLY